MNSLRSLNRAWKQSDEQLSELMEEMEASFARAREDLIESLTGLSRRKDGTLRSVDDAMAIIERVEAQKKIVADLGRAFPQAIESARPLLAEVGLSVPEVSRRAQLTYLNQASDAIGDVLGSLNRGLIGLFAEAATTPIPLRDMSKIVSDLARLPLAQARSVANTTLAGLQRETTAQAANGLPGGLQATYWLYTGPDDSAVRPFCKACVGKAFSGEQIAALRNGQGLTVRSYGGGYNCRHSLIPVSAAYLSVIGLDPATSSDVSRANTKARS